MLCFEDLDNLLFLNKESSDNTLLDALVAEDTSIYTLDGLLAVAQTGTFCRPGRLNTTEFALALATSWDLLGLLDVLVDQTATRCPYSEEEMSKLS